MKKILITGANGFLGQHLISYFIQQNMEVIAKGRKEASHFLQANNIPYFVCDITNDKVVENLIATIKPFAIVHTAAMSKPDECELDKTTCLKINVDATNNLSKAALKNNVSQFIFTSTDFIFGNNGPYAENDLGTPLNFYGNSKLQAEFSLQKNFLNTDTKLCIVRPVFMYGKAFEGSKGNFPQWVKDNLKENKKIKVVTDQLRTPTYVEDICAAIHEMILQNKSDTYHLAGSEIISPYSFACSIANLFQFDEKLIEPVHASTFKELAERPINNRLDCSKATAELNFKPTSIKEGLAKTFL
jgi:dTDP-4-dehydrorhamnose reductase